MMHGAWCWDVHFLDYFARHGFAAHAVNLRGHGNSEGRNGLRWTRIADYAEDVADALDRPKPTKVRAPLLILGVARDNMLRRGDIEATARAYRAGYEIIPDVAHNSMLEARWQRVAERILAWSREREV